MGSRGLVRSTLSSASRAPLIRGNLGLGDPGVAAMGLDQVIHAVVENAAGFRGCDAVREVAAAGCGVEKDAVGPDEHPKGPWPRTSTSECTATARSEAESLNSTLARIE